MFSSIVILKRNKEIYNVWHTGMTHTNLSKEEVIRTDLKQIAKELIENEENMGFRLSAMIMKGAVVIYSKQATYVLMDCNDAIMRISLKYEPNKNQEKTNKKEKKTATIDDETMAIWKYAQLPNDLASESDDEHGMQKKGDDSEQTIQIAAHKPHEDHNQNDDAQMDLGEAIDFNFLDDDVNDVPIPANDIEQLKKLEAEKIIDSNPLISMQDFMEKYHETIKTYSRPRQLRLPKHGILVIADEIDQLFKEAYEAREELIYSFPTPFADNQDDDAPAMPADYDDVDSTHNYNDDGDEGSDQSLLSLLPEIQSILKGRETMTLFDLTHGFDMQKKAVAFYTTLALCTEGKLDLQQERPDDPIIISKFSY